MKVLVKEKIGESGVQLLRDAGLDVELGLDWDQDELERRIGEFDGILIRSATELDLEPGVAQELDPRVADLLLDEDLHA